MCILELKEILKNVNILNLKHDLYFFPFISLKNLNHFKNFKLLLFGLIDYFFSKFMYYIIDIYLKFTSFSHNLKPNTFFIKEWISNLRKSS